MNLNAILRNSERGFSWFPPRSASGRVSRSRKSESRCCSEGDGLGSVNALAPNNAAFAMRSLGPAVQRRNQFDESPPHSQWQRRIAAPLERSGVADVRITGERTRYGRAGTLRASGSILGRCGSKADAREHGRQEMQSSRGKGELRR